MTGADKEVLAQLSDRAFRLYCASREGSEVETLADLLHELLSLLEREETK